MPRTPGNTRLKSARQHAGYGSQQALADALTRAASTLGLDVVVSVRQIRRWESATPPWPHADYQRLLTYVLGLPIEQLGFTPPWGHAPSDAPHHPSPSAPGGSPPLPLPAPGEVPHPASIATTYAMITAAHRHLYWSVQPAQIHSAVAEHTRMGTHLLAETKGQVRRTIAAALAESLLLTGRIEFFDLRQPDKADTTFIQALQAASEADDPLMGAAILAHAAFVPGWDDRLADATERMRAARAYARRATAPTRFLAWLDAVEAECATRCGHTRQALRLVAHAEDLLSTPDTSAVPDWFDWFSAAHLASFKGNIQLRAGHLPQARQTLSHALEALPSTARKQKIVILGDLAALEAAEGNPEAACARAGEALDELALHWYATGMDRIREVRRALDRWADHECVHQLDDRLYGWKTTLIALQR